MDSSTEFSEGHHTTDVAIYDSIDIWYRRWKLVNEWKRENSKLPPIVSYEVFSIFERHCVTALCYYGSDWLNHSNDVSKLVQEIKSSRKIKNGNAICVRIISLLAAMRGVYYTDHSQTEPTIQGIKPGYSYRDFRPKLNQALEESLRAYPIPNVIEMLLRYECLCPQGQQWAVQKNWLEKVRNTIGLDIIAFASPLNLQVPLSECVSTLGGRYGQQNKPYRYYSGYSEDSTFGSSGSFLKISPSILDAYAGKKCTIEVNPPFIERVLLDACHVIHALFKYIKEMKIDVILTVLFITPYWTDAEFYKFVLGPLRNDAIVCQCILQVGEHSFENATTGKVIESRQRSVVFDISNLRDPSIPVYK